MQLIHKVLPSRKAFILKDKPSLRYLPNSPAPFIVSVAEDGIGNKHPTLIGEFFYKHKIEGIKSISRVNEDLVNMELLSKNYANNLVDNKTFLIPYENCSCYIPLKYTTWRIIANNVHHELDIDSIGKFLSEKYDNVTSGRRIYKKNEYKALIPTSKLDIFWQGTTMPDFLYIFYAKCNVIPYIYNVTKCLNCLNLGHRAEYNGNLTCKSHKLCHKCATVHVAQDICPHAVKCFHCSENHLTFSLVCPELKNKKLLKK